MIKITSDDKAFTIFETTLKKYKNSFLYKVYYDNAKCDNILKVNNDLQVDVDTEFLAHAVSYMRGHKTVLEHDVFGLLNATEKLEKTDYAVNETRTDSFEQKTDDDLVKNIFMKLNNANNEQTDIVTTFQYTDLTNDNNVTDGETNKVSDKISDKKMDKKKIIRPRKVNV